jgi:general secretion pathway protein D
LLGDIPGLGALFGSTGKEVQRTELVVLLTPRVIRTPVDADAITAELKAKMELAEPTPPPPPPGAPAPTKHHGP